MHDFVALDPLSISVGVAKLTEADGAETCQGLRSNRVAAWPLQVGGDPTLLCGKGAGGFSPAPLPRGERGCGSAHGVGKTLGGRAVGEKSAVGTHFKGFGFTRHRASSV